MVHRFFDISRRTYFLCWVQSAWLHGGPGTKRCWLPDVISTVLGTYCTTYNVCQVYGICGTSRILLVRYSVYVSYRWCVGYVDIERSVDLAYCSSYRMRSVCNIASRIYGEEHKALPRCR